MRFSKCEFLDNLRIFALVCKGKFYLALFYFSFDPRSHMDILQSIFSTKGWKNKLETSAHVTLFKPWTQHICVFVHSEKTKMRDISCDFLHTLVSKNQHKHLLCFKSWISDHHGIFYTSCVLILTDHKIMHCQPPNSAHFPLLPKRDKMAPILC